jgi:hypothetical protein
MPLGKRQRSACVGPNVFCLLFCVVEKNKMVKEEIYINDEETFFIQVHGYENSNSIGGF